MSSVMPRGAQSGGTAACASAVLERILHVASTAPSHVAIEEWGGVGPRGGAPTVTTSVTYAELIARAVVLSAALRTVLVQHPVAAVDVPLPVRVPVAVGVVPVVPHMVQRDVPRANPPNPPTRAGGDARAASPADGVDSRCDAPAATHTVHPVVIVGLEGADAVCAVLAVWMCGACWSAVDVERPAHRAVLGADPPVFAAVLTSAAVLAALTAAVPAVETLPVVCLDALHPVEAQASVGSSAGGADLDAGAASGTRSSTRMPGTSLPIEPASALSGDRHCRTPAYVLFTSGTTRTAGEATAAVVGHGAVWSRFSWMLDSFPFAPGERACLTRPLTVVDAVWEALGPLCAGATVAAFPPSSRRDLGELAALLRAARVTRWLALPSVLTAISLHAVLPDLRLLSASGEALPTATARRALTHLAPMARLINLYGSTEVAGDVTWAELKAPTLELSRDRPVVPIGVAIRGSWARIEPESHEIVVGGACVPLGICRWPCSDAGDRAPSPPAPPRPPGLVVTTVYSPGAEYCTGDCGSQRADGTLCFDGRLAGSAQGDQTLNRNGNRVSLSEIEHVLHGMEGVRRCCVRVQARTGQVVAFVEMAPGTSETELNLGTTVPVALLPDRIEVMGTLPLLASGKRDLPRLQLQTDALPAPALCALPPCATQIGRIGRDLLCEILAPKLRRAAGQHDPGGDAGAGGSAADPTSAPMLPDRALWHMGLDSLDTMVLKLRLAALLPGKRLPAGVTLDFGQISHLTPTQLLGLLEAAAGKRHGAAADAVAVAVLERDGRGDPNINQLRSGGITHCAAGNAVAVRQCIDDGWIGRFAVDRAGSNALHWAAGGGHLEVVELLLETFGTDPGFVDAKNKAGRTALMQACKHGQLGTVAALVGAAANTTAGSKDGSTVFHYAVLGGDLATVQHLYELLSRDDAHTPNQHGCGAAHWAAAAGNVEVAVWLYERGFKFDELNDSRHGVVNAAAWKGHKAMVEWLVLAPTGPQLVDQVYNRDHFGRTTIDDIRDDDRVDLARWLESCAANPRAKPAADP